MGTYWQVTLRQRISAGHPALRELYLLAAVIDKVRSGHLLEALDALAGRFIAVEAAIQDGWNIAKHLEVAVPSDQAIAFTELQLAAQRHNNMVAKAHGLEGKGAWRIGGGRNWQGGGKDRGKSCLSARLVPLLENKLSGSVFEDCFRDSFWGEEDYTDAWVLCSVKFCQLMYGGGQGLRVVEIRRFIGNR